MCFLGTEKKRIRKNFGSIKNILNIPNLLSLQKDSYNNFLYGINGNESGLHMSLKSIFPILSNNKNYELKYENFVLKKYFFNEDECKIRGLTYSVSLIVTLVLISYEYKNDIKMIRYSNKQEVYMGDIPLMTSRCTFVVNGTERVVVSQLHRSPGVFFDSNKSKSYSAGKIIYNARIIPYRGSWLDIEFDSKDIIYVRIDRRKKIPVTVLLKALGYESQEILNIFLDFINFNIINNNIYMHFNPLKFKGEIFNFDIVYKNKIYVKKFTKIKKDHINNMVSKGIKIIKIPKDYLYGKILYDNCKNKLGLTLFNCNTCIDKNSLKLILENKIDKLRVIHINNNNDNIYISNTLRIDNIPSTNEALVEIYKVIRPGEPPSLDVAKKFFNSLFFSLEKYDLSDVGRMKINKSIGVSHKLSKNFLRKEDIVGVIKKLIDVKNGISIVDDVDNLSNRRIRRVGEMIENQFKLGLIRIEKTVKDRLSSFNQLENILPKDLINSKPLSSIMKDFFCSSQLSQFMDQNNPLSEITHKRRISSLGPGGLTRERAGFEVRDVHYSHYGKLCPIETPEGPNIGLINSLSLYSRINRYGFIETPYVVVINKKVTKKICYLSSIEDYNYVIAQSNVKISCDGLVEEEYVVCRYKGEFSLFSSNDINYMDVSPQQIVSLGASLIPFLEHNDANRSLMGSNMQRQAVPCIKSEAPLVGTGLERKTAIDSGSVIIAKFSGVVRYIDSNKIIIENFNNSLNYLNNIDIYYLSKFLRSNQNTYVNHTPLVSLGENVNKGDILCDGAAINIGELSLGQNIRVAFMSWNGYNFEDSILVSERIIQNDIFTSLHIQELSCVCRDTKLGIEEITSDIPNVNDLMLSKLDENGVIHVGAFVKSGDILVGKVTPKGETQLTPEEKLLRAIFGEKASEVKDTSLRVPSNLKGVVIDVQIFRRDKNKISKELLKLDNVKLDNMDINFKHEVMYYKNILYKRIVNVFKEYNIFYDFNKKNFLEKIRFFLLKINNKLVLERVNYFLDLFNNLKNIYNKKLKDYKFKINKGDELPPGVIKIVKVYVAVKRKLQVGDKMSGRHGNKGVVSKICAVEDMPYDDHGNHIDIILNPLGVPSRMNIGQIFETHLGGISKKIGDNIKKFLYEDKLDLLKIRNYLNLIYNIGISNKNDFIDFNSLNDDDLIILCKNLSNGLPVSTPVFDGVNEKLIKKLFKFCKLPESGQISLYDGLTGRKFDRDVTVGYMYIMKLNHLVDDKIHARSTGSYSLVTQQPLGGKSQFGGQRFGEMEVWALEAYGAAYTLQEMLTVKSDDVNGRTKMYKNIINNNHSMEPGIPESFNVLLKEIRSLAINMDLDVD